MTVKTAGKKQIELEEDRREEYYGSQGSDGAPVDCNQVGFYDGEINDRKTMYAYVVLQNIR